MVPGTSESQQKLGLGSGQGRARGKLAVGLCGTTAGEDTEAEVDGTVWPWSQRPAQDSRVCRRSHKQRLFRSLGSSGGGCWDSVDFRGIHFAGGELNWELAPPAGSEHEQATSPYCVSIASSLRWYLEWDSDIHVTIPTFQCLHEEHIK